VGEGFNLPHCMRTTSPLKLVWGGRLRLPRRVPGATGKNVGVQKNFLLTSLADYSCPNV